MAELIDIDHDSHDNLRLRKRHQLIFNIAVIDTASGEELGKLVDISTQGFMLTSIKNLEQETYKQLTFKIPNNLQIPHSVIFEAEVRWHKPDVNPEYELTGLQVTNSLQDFKRVSQSLVRKFGYDNSWD